MDKLILCLANSYKHGGRCIAGIEVIIEEGKLITQKSTEGIPIWIRPISHSLAGEVPLNDAEGIKVLSLVKIYDAQYAGNASHSEDYYYEKLQLLKTFNASDKFLEGYTDTKHQFIFGNKGRALTPNAFQCGNYSLMLVRTEGSEIYLDTRYTPKPRIKFVYNGINYDFPITDPEYLHRLSIDNSLYKSGYGVLYVVVSLGIEHEGWHSKLAATIILPNEINVKQTVASQNSVSSSDKSSLDSVSSKINYSSTKVSPLSKATPKSDSAIYYSKAENLRKIRQSNIDSSLHEKRIEYTAENNTKKNGCYIATSVYGSYDCPEVWTLRRYRDYKLSRTIYGRAFIHIYYVISPLLVKHFGQTKFFKRVLKKRLDLFVKKLEKCGYRNTPYND